MTRVLGGGAGRHDAPRAARARRRCRWASAAATRDLSSELAFHREMLEERHRAPRARSGRGPPRGAARARRRGADRRGLARPAQPAVRSTRSGRTCATASACCGATPGFTAAALLTLALGIGANTAIFTVVDAVLLRPLPYADPDRLVTVGDRNAEGFSSNVGFATVLDWRERSRTFETLGDDAGLAADARHQRRGGAAARPCASAGTISTCMGVRPALGRGFTADDDRPDHWRVLLLSDGLWRRRFSADPAIVGRTIVMNDREYRVIGVMPAVVRAARRRAVLRRVAPSCGRRSATT